MERQLARADHDLARWEAAYVSEVIDLADFRSKKAEIERRRTALLEEMARLQAEEEALVMSTQELDALATYCARVLDDLDQMSIEQKHRALEALDILVTWSPSGDLDVRGSIPIVIADSLSRRTTGWSIRTIRG